MHEFSLAQALLEEVNRVRRECGGRLTAFRVEVGDLSGVEPELLASAVEVLLADADERHVAFQLDRVAVEARCDGCENEFRVTNNDYHCPRCRDARLRVLRGESLTLRDVTFETEET